MNTDAIRLRAGSVLIAVAFLTGGLLGQASAEEPAAAEQKPPVLQKAPDAVSMATQMMHRALVQDLLRVGPKLFLAGERGHIGWSDDNGQTWVQAKVPTIQDINAIYFVTADVGWAVGHDGNIFNTIDAGKTWSLQLDGLAYNLVRAKSKMEVAQAKLSAKQEELDEVQAQLDEAQAAARPKQKLIDQLQEKFDALDEVVYDLDFQVRDAQKILTEENAPWPLMDVWFSDLNTGFAVGAFNAFLMTKDGGKTWEDISGRLENPDGLHLNAVAGLDSTVFVLGEAGLVFRSLDAGATWKALDSPDDGSFFAIHLARQQGSNKLTVLIAGLEGMIYRSVNSGDRWEALESPLNYNLNAIYADDQGLVIIVGNDGAVLRSNDGGQTLEPFRQQNQMTLSSVVVADNGNYVVGGAGGIQVLKPADLVHHE